LQWLANTLLQAEKNEEFVHILAHIPPNHKHCQSTWKREYLKIINRYAHIIRAQFNGHTHNDELQLLFYSKDNRTKINNIAWNGGSVTAYSNLNPNYKLYIIDSNNYVSIIILIKLNCKRANAQSDVQISLINCHY